MVTLKGSEFWSAVAQWTVYDVQHTLSHESSQFDFVKAMKKKSLLL
jgi:prophage tail gpP-like protein